MSANPAKILRGAVILASGRISWLINPTERISFIYGGLETFWQGLYSESVIRSCRIMEFSPFNIAEATADMDPRGHREKRNSTVGVEREALEAEILLDLEDCFLGQTLTRERRRPWWRNSRMQARRDLASRVSLGIALTSVVPLAEEILDAISEQS